MAEPTLDELRDELETLQLQHEIDILKDGAPVGGATAESVAAVRQEVGGIAERTAKAAGEALAIHSDRIGALEGLAQQVNDLADLVGRYQGAQTLIEGRIATLEAQIEALVIGKNGGAIAAEVTP